MTHVDLVVLDEFGYLPFSQMPNRLCRCQAHHATLKPSVYWIKGLGIIAICATIGAAGIYLGGTEDTPGATLIGILLMIGAMVLAVKIVRRKT